MYQLRNANNQNIESAEKGTIGGHAKLGIYGRLDCPHAARWIAKGHYVAQRVFFADEATAIQAGFRPCGCCMKEEYKKWKVNQ